MGREIHLLVGAVLRHLVLFAVIFGFCLVCGLIVAVLMGIVVQVVRVL